MLFQVSRNINSTHEVVIDNGLVRIKQELVADQSSGVLQQIQLTGANRLVTFPLRLMVTCPKMMTGCTTDTSCRPRDDLFGHYTCGDGWRGGGVPAWLPRPSFWLHSAWGHLTNYCSYYNEGWSIYNHCKHRYCRVYGWRSIHLPNLLQLQQGVKYLHIL